MTERRAPGNAADEGQRWLDGLAGRDGAGDDHADGKLLRDSLKPSESVDMPPWAEIERRAELAAMRVSVGQMHAASARAVPAANASAWRAWVGVAAALVLGVGLAVALWLPSTESTMRGVGTTGAGDAMWRVAEPQQAAQALASELQALGAQVALQAEGASVRLVIAAPVSAAVAVNQRLAALETALDAQGQLSLRVVAP